jgi:small-conductance mechanosensitive channel
MIHFLELPWVRRVLFGAGGLALGLMLEYVVVDRVRKLAERTRFKWDDLLIKSVRGLPTVWLGAGGLFIAASVNGVQPLQVGWLRTAFTVVLIGSVVVAGMRLVAGAVEIMSSHAEGAIQSSTLVVNLARLAVGTLGLVLILQNLGIEITPLITALGIGGLAVALAMQDTLGNLFAGVQIILSRQVRPHDYVRLASGEEGWVTDVRARNTTIETFPDGNLLMVPNSVLSSSIVKNFTLPRAALWVSVEVGVSYGSDLEHVERVTREVAKDVLATVDGGVNDQEPVMFYRGFGASSIDFDLRMMVRDFRSQGPIRHAFIKRLHRRYGEEGIEIPFPIRTVVMKGPAGG